MTKGYATSSTRRSSAGVTNTGPRIDSWSSHSRTRPASRGRPRGTGISSALTAMSAGEDLLHFGLGPGDGVPGRGAGDLLGGLDGLRELPDADVARSVGLVAAVRAAEAPVVVDAVGGDQLPLLRHDIGTDGVVDPAGLALLDRLVVAGVRPRQHLGLHAIAEHLLVPLDRLDGGRRVDAHGLAVLVQLHAADRPQHGAGRGARVVVLPEGNPDGIPHLSALIA